MRIISGNLKGRKLQSFRGAAVRPTPDRVREALFSILGQKTSKAVVLDLFAGTGALGIEAVSRGAQSAFFIDISAESLAILHNNLRHCRLTQATQAVQWDIARNLNCLKGHAQPFNLVFMDPPYRRHLTSITIKHLLQAECLANAATIVAEHEPDLDWDPLGSSICMIDSRRYGRTQLTFFAFEPGSTTTITR